MKTSMIAHGVAGSATLLLVLFLMVMPASLARSEEAYTESGDDTSYESAPLDFEYVYESLRQYGYWHGREPYGQIWVPANLPAGWRPYVDGGHWVYTDAGWYWYSDYDWGWLVFHYGRWYYDETYGWAWVPGYVWSPAWVTWYSNEGYVGWAPIPPVDYGDTYTVEPDSWFFVSCERFVSPYVNWYYVSPTVVSPLVCSPYLVINNYCFYWGGYYCDGNGTILDWYGPTVRVIERGVGRHLRRYAIRETGDRDHNNRVRDRSVIEVFRPASSETRRIARRVAEHRLGTGNADHAPEPIALPGTVERRQPVERRTVEERSFAPTDIPAGALERRTVVPASRTLGTRRTAEPPPDSRETPRADNGTRQAPERASITAPPVRSTSRTVPSRVTQQAPAVRQPTRQVAPQQDQQRVRQTVPERIQRTRDVQRQQPPQRTVPTVKPTQAPRTIRNEQPAPPPSVRQSSPPASSSRQSSPAPSVRQVAPPASSSRQSSPAPTLPAGGRDPNAARLQSIRVR